MKFMGKIWPFILSILIAIIFFFLQNSFKEVDKVINKLIDSSMTVAGTLLGFLLTITTIINTIHTRRMNFIRESGNYPILHKYLNMAITLNIVNVSLVIIIPFAYGVNLCHEVLRYFYSFQLWIVLWNWFANIRFTSVFVKLLSE